MLRQPEFMWDRARHIIVSVNRSTVVLTNCFGNAAYAEKVMSITIRTSSDEGCIHEILRQASATVILFYMMDAIFILIVNNINEK